MKETYQILPVYAGDVSGACSALYELGGMTVMHDPSGCNSTYNTFDETRWYDKESLIFLSGLTDMDAVMGNDKKLIADVEQAANTLHPAFIALVNSPIPFLNGTDFTGICRLLEKHTGIPSFYIPTNGMHDYTEGAGQAFLTAAQRLVEDTDLRCPNSVNILGMTPLDFAGTGSSGALHALLENGGFSVISNWSLDTGLDEIRRSGQAAVNLVVSSTGLYAARALQKRFGTPYVTGIPVGLFADAVFQAIHTAGETGENQRPQQAARSECDSSTVMIGEPIVTTSLSAAMALKTGISPLVLCPTEITADLLAPWDRSVQGEEAMTEALRSASRVIADPMYRSICPSTAEFISLPHLALSGRMYRHDYPNHFADRHPVLGNLL